VSLLFLILLSGFALYAKRKPYLLFGWLWFLVSLLPVVGIVQIGGQSFADRWTYLPHFGLLVAISFLVVELAQEKSWQRYLPILAAAVVILAAGYSRAILPTWENSETVFRQALSVTEDNFLAHTNLGINLEQSGKLEEALPHLREAVRVNPGYPEALNGLGV